MDMVIKYYTDDGLFKTEYNFEVDYEQVDKFLEEFIKENRKEDWFQNDYEKFLIVDENNEVIDIEDKYEVFEDVIKEHFREDFRKWLIGED